MRTIIKFFDKLEDRVRAFLSRRPVLYSMIGGTSLVIFWSGVTTVVQSVSFFNTLTGGLLLMFVSVSVLLLIGLFVSFFIGDTIIISGIKGEKKVVEKQEDEILAEARMLDEVNKKVDEIDNAVKEIQSKIK